MKDYKNIFEQMVTATQKYLEDNHLNAMVLGISGGIDSTVTAAICHEVEKRNLVCQIHLQKMILQMYV